MIMQAIGVAEDNIFKKRKEDDVRWKPEAVAFSMELFLFNRSFSSFVKLRGGRYSIGFT